MEIRQSRVFEANNPWKPIPVELRFNYAPRSPRKLNCKESYTVYMSWGKGIKWPLRFSKAGDSHTERRFSTHYVKQLKEMNKIEAE